MRRFISITGITLSILSILCAGLYFIPALREQQSYIGGILLVIFIISLLAMIAFDLFKYRLQGFNREEKNRYYLKLCMPFSFSAAGSFLIPHDLPYDYFHRGLDIGIAILFYGMGCLVLWLDRHNPAVS